MKLDMEKPLVTIDNWAVVERRNDLRYEKLMPGKHLIGSVFGHTSVPDAEIVYTSPILHLDLGLGLVETRNTLYQLGEISGAYKNWEHEERHESVAA